MRVHDVDEKQRSDNNPMAHDETAMTQISIDVPKSETNEAINGEPTNAEKDDAGRVRNRVRILSRLYCPFTFRTNNLIQKI